MAKIKRTHLTVLIAALIAMAIVGAPLSGYAAGEPGCSATISSDLINIPVVRLGDALYSLDLQYLGASGNLIEFSIANVQTTTQDCAVQSSITSGSSLMLNIASLMLGSTYYDVGLEYVSSQERNSSKVSARNTSHTFRIINTFMNSNVWKGSSYCTADKATAFPGIYVTAGWRARGRNVTLSPGGGTSDELSNLGYMVLEGQLDFYLYTESVHHDGVYLVNSIGPVETTMNGSSGTIYIGNTYFSGEGMQSMSVEETITVYNPFPPNPPITTTTTTTNWPAYWLHIPQNVFQRTNPNELTGKWIENTLGGELTCGWRFYYYP